MLSLHQKLALQQKLSPQQIQYQKLLQLNTLSLEQRIKTELEMNPILEEVQDYELTQEEIKDPNLEHDSRESAAEEEMKKEDENYTDGADEFDMEDFMNDGELDEIRMNKSPDDEDDVRPVAPEKVTLGETLLDQLHMLDLTEEEMIFGEMIIGSLKKDGYFKDDLQRLVDDFRIFEHVEISYEKAEEILKKIQILDPIGIAARSLQECLIIQIENYKFDPYLQYLAKQVLLKHFNDFANKRFDNIQKELKLSKETLREVIELIQKLDPKPGEGTLISEEANQISPDFSVEKVDDNFIITLNDRFSSSVTISQTYLEMLDSNKRRRKMNERDKETHKFLREKFESAKWFILSIQQRRNTLMKIMRAIVEKQWEFFEYGAKSLKPMIYKDIADIVGMDISTISRVVNGKYVQSPQGIHELKYFFSEGLSTDSGTEISNKHIKELIKEIIDKEPKRSPYSDDKIASILNERGIQIARRTIAKYREQMFIPVARLRKEL